jgi:transposase
MHTLGIDLHKQFALWSLLDQKGNVLWQKKLITDLEKLPEETKCLPSPCQAVLEPTGCFSLYAEILKDRGIDTHLAHPIKVKYIAESKNKNDKIDATILAQLLRANFLPEAYLPSQAIRELRSLLVYRNQLVSMRTMAKNRMRMLLNQLGIKTKLSDIFGKKGIIFLQGLELSIINQIQRDQLIHLVGTLNSQIKILNQSLEKITKKDDDVQRMITIPTIGLIASVTIKAYVGDFKRFPDSSKLVSYAGLIPSVRQSGEHTKTGHITKEGPRLLRAVLVQSITGMKPSAGYLYEQYHKKGKEIGYKKARVMMAKKLLIIAFRIVKDKTTYVDNPLNTKKMGKTCYLNSAS